jgi:hypothetical protein
MSNDLNNVGVSQQAAPIEQTPVQQQQSPAWYSGFESADVDYIKNKGWDKDPSKGYVDVFKAYKHAERIIGTAPDKLVKLPSPDNKDEFNEFYRKIGRPEDPSGYQYQIPEGVDEQIIRNEDLSWFSKTAHELGLTSDQYTKLLSSYTENRQQGMREMLVDTDMQKTAEREELLKEWGRDFEKNVNMAADAMVLLGIEGTDLEGVDIAQKLLGHSAVSKLFHKIATKIGEDSIRAQKVAYTSQQSDEKDPAAAITKLLNDLSRPENREELQQYARGTGKTRERVAYLEQQVLKKMGLA